VALVVTAILALSLVGMASAQGPVTKGESADKSWSALDKVGRFTETLKDAGFSLQPGEFTYWDLVQQCCLGMLPDTLANNPWPNVYVVLQLAPHPGVDPPLVDRYWQLRQDEAIVLVGQTPPPAAYFSYQTFMITLPGSRDRRAPPPGDTINIGTIKTIGPDKYNRPIVYIITGNRETERRVQAAARKAGYPDAIINVEAISPVIAPLGIGDKGSWLAFGHRVAVPLDKPAVEAYARNPPYKVFRVTPNEQLAEDPEPVPVLRVRGTGHTEMELWPAVQRLRQAILKKYSGVPVKELDTKVWEVTTPDGRELKTEKPYVGLQRGIQVLGATRDTNYLANYPNFMLRQGVSEFVIVYGVNHQKTGKATYASFSIYADKDRWFGLKDGTTLSPDFGASAEQYLPGDPEAQYLYAWKVARNCNGETYCMEVKKDFEDLEGNTYTCNLYDWYHGGNLLGPFDLDKAELFFLWRSYMEPATKVGPDDNELVYDRAIYFGPYFAGLQR
jgi:hypothetical protein